MTLQERSNLLRSRVLISGGRDFFDIDFFEKKMNQIKPKFIIHGGAKGADMLASNYADAYNILKQVYPAQ